MKKVVRKYSGIVLLLLFVSYYGGITLFRHVHQWGDNTIVHSHPHNRNCEHSHTAEELQFIQQISVFLTLAAAVLLFLPGRFDRLLERFICKTIFRPAVWCRIARSQRGPPAYPVYS